MLFIQMLDTIHTMAERETELYNSMRSYGEMRFKQLTLLLAWLAIAGTGVSQSTQIDFLDGASLKLIIGFASMLVTGIIWIMEISSTKHWVAYKEALEDKLPSNNLSWKQFNATNMTVLLYAISYVFWFYASCEWKGNYIFLTIYGLIFILLIVYTILNYLPLWKHKQNSTNSK